MSRRNRSGETARSSREPLRTARARARPPAAANSVRIIGGEWRGRRLRFPDVAGLRPTPDRVRETLFNWLRAVLPGARCLDLFAGSGVLGFEALSRGAARATLVERDRDAACALRSAAAELGAGDRVDIVEQDAAAYLARIAVAFDVIFLDPPYDAQLLPPTLATLARRALVRPGGYVYFEAPAATPLPSLPAGWQLHRSGRAGEVGYHLAVYPGATADVGDDVGGAPEGNQRDQQA